MIKILLDLGPSIFLPIVIFIMGLIIKMPLKKLIVTSLTMGIAFVSMSVVLDFMFETISPVANDFAKNTGLFLNTIDVGWAPVAAISWAWPYAMFMFPIQIGINIIMLRFNLTNVLNLDMLNVWGKVLTALLVFTISNNLIIAFLFAILQTIIELKIGEKIEENIENMTNIPSVTSAHPMFLQMVFMKPINDFLDKIIKNSESDISSWDNKLGVFKENSVMGFLIGFILAIIAKYSINDSLQIAIKLSSALVLFPLTADLFTKALTPVTSQAKDFLEKKFKSKKIYISLDWVILAGQAEIWIVSVLLIPITIIITLIFSKFGISNILPLAGLVNIIVVVPSLIITNKNIIKMLIISSIFTPAYLIVSSIFAKPLTTLAGNLGTLTVPSNQYISYYAIEAPIFRWSLAYSAILDIKAIVILIIFILLFINFFKNK